MLRLSPLSIALGIAVAVVVFWLYRKAQTNTVSSPLMDTRIDLNPSLYAYPGVSSVPA